MDGVSSSQSTQTVSRSAPPPPRAAQPTPTRSDSVQRSGEAATASHAQQARTDSVTAGLSGRRTATAPTRPVREGGPISRSQGRTVKTGDGVPVRLRDPSSFSDKEKQQIPKDVREYLNRLSKPFHMENTFGSYDWMKQQGWVDPAQRNPEQSKLWQHMMQANYAHDTPAQLQHDRQLLTDWISIGTPRPPN